MHERVILPALRSRTSALQDLKLFVGSRVWAVTGNMPSPAISSRLRIVSVFNLRSVCCLATGLEQWSTLRRAKDSIDEPNPAHTIHKQS